MGRVLEVLEAGLCCGWGFQLIPRWKVRGVVEKQRGEIAVVYCQEGLGPWLPEPLMLQQGCNFPTPQTTGDPTITLHPSDVAYLR
jgi:hypothetical protein